MCLDSTKQGYSFLKSLCQAGEDGLPHEDIVANMKELCSVQFGSDHYATAPRPLMKMIGQSAQAHSIAVSPAGFWAITEIGKRRLNVLEALVRQ